MRSDLRLTRYFVATAEELHFRRAAERLGIAQPALSRAIRQIEAEIGVALFDRTNRSVQITTAGQAFLRRSRQLLAIAECGLDEARTANDGRSGTLRIGYTDFAIAGPLPNLLKAFRESFPGIKVRPQNAVTLTQLKLIDEARLDMGFVTGPIRRPDIAQRAVLSERYICVFSDTHPLARKRSIRMADLADYDFVHGNPGGWSHFYDHLFPLCRRAGFEPRIVQEAFNTAGILGLVSCGMGVTILTEKVCSAVHPGLIARPIEDVRERLITSAVWRHNHTLGPMQHFTAFLRALPDVDAAGEAPATST